MADTPPPARIANPTGLSTSRTAVYETLTQVKAARILNGIPPPNLLVISDLDKDYDDLAAMTVLKELHRLDIVRLRGYVANLTPAGDRARIARGALDSMGLSHIPVGVGTDGVPNFEGHNLHDYELKALFVAKEPVELFGLHLLTEQCEKAKAKGEKITLVLLSSHKDASAFTHAQPELFASTVDHVKMQGGVIITEHGELTPDMAASNMRYDPDASKQFLSFIHNQTNTRTTTYTKIATFATPVSAELFEEMEATGQAVGKHLRNVHTEQDLTFYDCACDPEKRFAPHITQEWFLKNKTSWFEQMGKEPTPPSPQDRPGIIPYLTKAVVYDALAALGAAGDDVMEALGVLEKVETGRHVIVGRPGHVGVAEGGIKMSNALSALMLGSQLACLQGLPSETELN